MRAIAVLSSVLITYILMRYFIIFQKYVKKRSNCSFGVSHCAALANKFREKTHISFIVLNAITDTN